MAAARSPLRMARDESEDENSDGSDSDNSSSSGDSSCDGEANDDLPPQRLAFVVMTGMIGGYTLTSAMQHYLKVRFHISDKGSASQVYIQSAAMVQWCKTITTIGQNFFFACLSPKTRVYIAMAVMFVGVLIPPLFVFTLGITWVGLAAITFSTIGLSLGVFESTFLSVISPLGPLTKSWAIMGFPAAFALVNILGQSLMALFDMPVVVIFWCIACGIPVAAVAFMQIVPSDTKVKGKSYKQTAICDSLRDWRSWAVELLPFILINFVSHFVMESIGPAFLNVYNAHKVALFGRHETDHLMDHTWYFVVLFSFWAAGDLISRRVGYCLTLDTYRANLIAIVSALLCSLLGLYLATLGVAIVSWAAAFLSQWGVGFFYATTARFIDKFIPRKHNLAAYSIWTFVGYSGAISGAVLVSMVMGWICHGETYQYQCT